MELSLPVFARNDAGPADNTKDSLSTLPRPSAPSSMATKSHPTLTVDTNCSSSSSSSSSNNNIAVVGVSPDEENNFKESQCCSHGLAVPYLNYIPFEEDEKEQQTGEKNDKHKVDTRIFFPLYIATASLIFLPMMPSFLVLFFVTIWAVLFVVTPLWYLIYYDPLEETCGSSVPIACSTYM